MSALRSINPENVEGPVTVKSLPIVTLVILIRFADGLKVKVLASK